MKRTVVVAAVLAARVAAAQPVSLAPAAIPHGADLGVAGTF